MKLFGASNWDPQVRGFIEETIESLLTVEPRLVRLDVRQQFSKGALWSVDVTYSRKAVKRGFDRETLQLSWGDDGLCHASFARGARVIRYVEDLRLGSDAVKLIAEFEGNPEQAFNGLQGKS